MISIQRRKQLAKSLSRKGDGFVVSVSDQGMKVLLEDNSTLSAQSVPTKFYGIPVTTGNYNGITRTETAA